MAEVETVDELSAPEGPADVERWWRLGAFVVFAVLVVVLAFVVGRRTAGPGADEVDVGFLQDMTSHHEQAVDISLEQLARGTDQEARGFAQEVLLFQRFELGKMDAMLAHRGLRPLEHDPGRPVMRWMGMGGTLAEMPGMASEAALDAWAADTGAQIDISFLEIMAEHHRGGVHMADYAAEHASDPAIRELAAVMARNQRGEVSEYERAVQRLRGATS